MSVDGLQRTGGAIARATVGDLAEVRALAEASKDGPRWPTEAWKAYLPGAREVNRTTVVLILRNSQGGLLGWIAGTALGETAELEGLLVHPEARSRGHGRTLLLAWLDWVVQQGCIEAFLELRASNHGAMRLYQRCGFVPQGCRRGYYGDPVEDAVLLRFTVRKQAPPEAASSAEPNR